MTALNLVLIPLHAPDDIDHFERAYMLSRGEVWPQTRPGVHSGGMIDTALQLYVQQEVPAVHLWSRVGHLRAPVGPDPAARDAGWSGDVTFSPFLAAAITYLPLIYLPQTMAIWMGRSLDLSIEATIFWAREFNGLTAILLAFGAMAVWPIPSALLLLLLFLPKTMAQLSSNSPDGIYIALVIGIVGLICRAPSLDGSSSGESSSGGSSSGGSSSGGSFSGAPVGRWPYVALAGALLVICPVRPPAAALALPIFALARRQAAWIGIALVMAAIGVSVAWTVTILNSTVTDACADDPTPIATMIMEFLRTGVHVVPATIVEHGRYYLVSLIGELGSGNGPAGRTDELPGWIYAAALTLGAVAIAMDMGSRFSLAAELRITFALSAAVMTFLIFLALYVTCSSYHLPVIRGVQGRYFVPVLIGLVPVFAGTIRPWTVGPRAYSVALLSFALAGFGTLVSEGLRIYWMR